MKIDSNLGKMTPLTGLAMLIGSPGLVVVDVHRPRRLK